MRQWLLRKTGWKVVDSQIVKSYINSKATIPSGIHTLLLYQKRGRFKTVKIRGEWTIHP